MGTRQSTLQVLSEWVRTYLNTYNLQSVYRNIPLPPEQIGAVDGGLPFFQHYADWLTEQIPGETTLLERAGQGVKVIHDGSGQSLFDEKLIGEPVYPPVLLHVYQDALKFTQALTPAVNDQADQNTVDFRVLFEQMFRDDHGPTLNNSPLSGVPQHVSVEDWYKNDPYHESAEPVQTKGLDA